MVDVKFVEIVKIVKIVEIVVSLVLCLNTICVLAKFPEKRALLECERDKKSRKNKLGRIIWRQLKLKSHHSLSINLVMLDCAL